MINGSAAGGEPRRSPSRRGPLTATTQLGSGSSRGLPGRAIHRTQRGGPGPTPARGHPLCQIPRKSDGDTLLKDQALRRSARDKVTREPEGTVVCREERGFKRFVEVEHAVKAPQRVLSRPMLPILYGRDHARPKPTFLLHLLERNARCEALPFDNSAKGLPLCSCDRRHRRLKGNVGRRA